MDDSINSLFTQKQTEDDSVFVFDDELLLAKSIYNTTAKREGVEALAQTIQNLMFVEPGTYPNQPNLGVGIENYEFEFLDSATMYDLKEKVDANIKKFINTYYHIDFDVDTIKNSLGKNVLFFIFSVSDNDSYTSVSQINILFGKDKDNNKVISKIIL